MSALTSGAPDAGLLGRLPPNRLEQVRQVTRVADGLGGLELYLAGGFVRDLLLGGELSDLDFVVAPAQPGHAADAAAPRLARAVANALGGRLTVHESFATAAVVTPEGDVLDFATARTETYARPGALPDVRVPATMLEDLARRDFSINAMALRLDGPAAGALLDPHGGRADLVAGLLRTLHARSLADDPTRILRGARYAGRLGFRLDDASRAQVGPALAVLPAVSGERLRYDLELIFTEPRAAAILASLHAERVLAGLHPALAWGESQAERLALLDSLPRPGWALAGPPDRRAACLALLLDGAVREEAVGALDRLDVTRGDRQAVLGALDVALAGDVPPSQAAAALDGLSEAALTAAYVLRPAARAAIDGYLARGRFVRAEMTGHDLEALGLQPGPDFRRILWCLRAARLDGEVTDRAGELALVKLLANLE